MKSTTENKRPESPEGVSHEPGGARTSERGGNQEEQDTSMLVAAQKAVGVFIRAARESRGLSQDEVATLTMVLPWPVSRAEISAVERGQHLPNLRTLVTLSRVLRLDPNETVARAETAIEILPEWGHLSDDELTTEAHRLYLAGDFRGALAALNEELDRLRLSPPMKDIDRLWLLSWTELYRAATLVQCGHIRAAKAAVERGITYAEGISDLQAEGLGLLASVYARMDNALLARSTAHLSILGAKRCGSDVLGRCLISKGVTLWRVGNCGDAYSAFLDAFECSQRSCDVSNTMIAQGNVGFCMNLLGRSREALVWLARALDDARSSKSLYTQVLLYLALGETYLELGDLDAAKAYAVSAMDIAKPRQYWRQVIEIEWLRHMIVRSRKPTDSDRHRLATIKRLLTYIEDYPGDPVLSRIRTGLKGLR